jgi:ferredoxin-NADP reductase
MSIFSHIYDDHDNINATLVHSAKNESGFIFRQNIEHMVKYKQSKLKAFWTTTEYADRVINKAGILRRTETDFVGRINKHLLSRTRSVHSTNNRSITLNNTLYFVCGPKEMVRDVKQILLQMNVTEPFIRTEQW